MEINEEKHGESEPIVPINIVENKSESYTIIDNLPNNSYKITYVVVGKKSEEKYLCGLCQATNGHIEKCPNAKTKEDSKENPFSGSKLFSREGTIFTYQVLPEA